MSEKDLSVGFYQSQRSEFCPFVVNDAVLINTGPYKGRYGAVIALQSEANYEELVIELGNGEGDVVVNADWLELVDMLENET